MRLLLALLVSIGLLCPKIHAQEQKYVALTFDDGPSGRYTQRLLEGLARRNVRATFLLCGYRLEESRDLAAKIRDGGHEIGLHGYSHGDMSKMTRAEITEEIRKNLALLPPGCQPVFLRPPGGNSGEILEQVAAEYTLALLKWSVDPLDWKNHDALAVETAVVENVRSGDIILLHDMCDCSVDAALAIVDRLQSLGFRFVTVSELAEIHGCSIIPGQTYSAFR